MPEVEHPQLLKFSSARGVVSLVVCGETDDAYIVCAPEEYKAAREAGREPLVLGFPKADVVQ